eukprot:scaffold152069_cov33-Tisochrysis_lutea.AAC.3
MIEPLSVVPLSQSRGPSVPSGSLCELAQGAIIGCRSGAAAGSAPDPCSLEYAPSLYADPCRWPSEPASDTIDRQPSMAIMQ